MSKEQLLVVGGILGSLVLIIGGAILFNNKRFGGDPAKLLTHGRPVHWHTVMSFTVCGKDIPAPRSAPGGELGSGPIHTHDDALSHMEDAFDSSADIAVKKYLQSVGVPFSEKGIFDKTDGSVCQNQEATQSAQASNSATTGHLHGTADDKPIEDILNYPMHDPNTQADDYQEKVHIIYD